MPSSVITFALKVSNTPVLLIAVYKREKKIYWAQISTAENKIIGKLKKFENVVRIKFCELSETTDYLKNWKKLIASENIPQREMNGFFVRKRLNNIGQMDMAKLKLIIPKIQDNQKEEMEELNVPKFKKKTKDGFDGEDFKKLSSEEKYWWYFTWLLFELEKEIYSPLISKRTCSTINLPVETKLISSKGYRVSYSYENLVQRDRRAKIISGRAGMGKSTFVYLVMSYFLQSKESNTPVYIDVNRDILLWSMMEGSTEKLSKIVVACFRDKLKVTSGLDEIEMWLNSYLRLNSTVIFVDGLADITSEREKIFTMFEALHSSKHSILATGGYYSLETLKELKYRFDFLALDPFTEAQVVQFKDSLPKWNNTTFKDITEKLPKRGPIIGLEYGNPAILQGILNHPETLEPRLTNYGTINEIVILVFRRIIERNIETDSSHTLLFPQIWSTKLMDLLFYFHKETMLVQLKITDDLNSAAKKAERSLYISKLIENDFTVGFVELTNGIPHIKSEVLLSFFVLHYIKTLLRGKKEPPTDLIKILTYIISNTQKHRGIVELFVEAFIENQPDNSLIILKLIEGIIESDLAKVEYVILQQIGLNWYSKQIGTADGSVVSLDLSNLQKNDTNPRLGSIESPETWSKFLFPKIKFLKKIEKLDISGNDLSTLPQSFGNFSELRELNLSNNQFTAIPEILMTLTNLEILILNENKLDTIPETIGKLTKLRDLDLGANRLKRLPDNLLKLKELRVLVLGINKLERLPIGISKFNKLRELHLGWNQITEFPSEIVEIKSLNALTLWGNQITVIPEEISNLSNLNDLNLRTNLLKEFPKGVLKLFKLHRLNLDSNKIGSIPEEIQNLSELRILNLWSNQIKIVPDGLTKLQNLQILSLWGNRIEDLQESFSNLSTLRKLNLRNNKLKSIPKGITGLPELKELDLTSNSISEIPEDINELNRLNILRLWGNRIKFIPDAIQKLEKLVELNLNQNNIEVLPDSILWLSNLEKLYIAKNYLNLIPENFTKLNKLKLLHLQGNNLLKLSQTQYETIYILESNGCKVRI